MFIFPKHHQNSPNKARKAVLGKQADKEHRFLFTSLITLHGNNLHVHYSKSCGIKKRQILKKTQY